MLLNNIATVAMCLSIEKCLAKMRFSIKYNCQQLTYLRYSSVVSLADSTAHLSNCPIYTHNRSESDELLYIRFISFCELCIYGYLRIV